MDNQTVSEGKTTAIIAYITVIGTLIAFIMNQKTRNSFASFHIRQALGIFLMGVVLNFITKLFDLGFAFQMLGVLIFLLWVVGLVYAFQGKEKTIPVVGDYFQQWFKNI